MREVGMGEAARNWQQQLDAWAIPEHILAAAPESPWGFPPALWRERTSSSTPTHQRVAEALRAGGTILDVGAGTGAASLAPAVSAHSSRVIGVDQSGEMLSAFAKAADDAGLAHEEIEGTWPVVAARTPIADVVVCANVLYNVGILPPFLRALQGHARRRVVVEITEVHPQTAFTPLWLHFHELPRPRGPNLEDALAVLRETGIEASVERWRRDAPDHSANRAEFVAFVRRRLCLRPEGDPEIDEFLGDHAGLQSGHMATIWWDV